MSEVIKTKLTTVYNNLVQNEKNLATSKKAIADALRFNGITNVTNTETFARYAELIRRLKSANAMIMEFTIPSTATTAYKRTLVLPMSMSTAGTSYNDIALEVIEQEKALMPAMLSLESPLSLSSDEEKETIDNSHLIEDMYGNIITDGNYTEPITMEDVHQYLTEEQAEEFVNAANELGISLFSVRAAEEGGVFEPDTSTTYSYTVDWGDGTPVCTYDHTKSLEERKPAIFHTYASPGVYQVTINGVFKRLYSNTTSWSNWVKDGQYVLDNDGTYVLNGINYNMRYGLTSIIAWGNTLLNNMANGLCYCEKLTDIPMYDTTNSFIDVTDFSYAFYRCMALKSLPFNESTNKGLFSGCVNATTFAACFQYCTNMEGAIPPKLIDGCPNVKSVAGMFAYSKFSGGIPTGLLAGMSKLTNASEMFANCALSGALDPTLFKDCPDITTIYRLFYGVGGVTGKLTRDFIGGLSKLTDMRQAFYNCKGITGFNSDAFYNVKADGINCRDAFYGSGITEIPNGLLSAMTGKNHLMERMFGNCTKLTSLASTSLANLKVANARGMFGGCTALASALPTANPDWNTLEGMSRWYGAFAKTVLSDINTVCIELGGNGERKFPESKVGMIALKNGGFVEGKAYSFDANDKPIGIVYADVYVDSTKSVPSIGQSVGNVVSKDAANAVHKIYVTVFNDTTKQWTNGQVNAEDITTITNTSDVNVAYNMYNWNADGTVATLKPTRYNGEEYTKAINDWRVSKNMATLAGGKYAKTDTDKYDAVEYVMSYNGVEGTGVQDLKKYSPFLPDAADLWDQFTMRYFIQKMIDYVVAKGNGYTTSNCYAMRDGTYYWASAEYYQTGAWYCGTGNAGCYYGYGKWDSFYVRPSLAIKA